jgi:hypothetical protein
MYVAVAELRRIAEAANPRAVVRALLEQKRKPAPIAEAQPQLALWVRDADGLPPRPWRIHPDDHFDCKVLGCKGLRARVCVARQQATDIQRTRQTSRGQGTDYPSCDTRRCAQGRGIREALDRRESVTWKGAGPGGRFERLAKDVAKQEAARRRLRETGLLDEAPSMDQPPAAVESGGGDTE